MKPIVRTALISCVVGIVLGAAGPLAGWLGARSDTAACTAELDDTQAVLSKASELAQARARTAEEELVRARAGGGLLRALADLDAQNFGLAEDRVKRAALGLEEAGQADAAAKLRSLSLGPEQASSARQVLLALAGELLDAP